MRAKATPCPDGVREGKTVLTGRDQELVRWALEQVETRLAAGGNRLLVLWAVVFTASVSTDSDAVLGAVVRALITADDARWAASFAPSPAGSAR